MPLIETTVHRRPAVSNDDRANRRRDKGEDDTAFPTSVSDGALPSAAMVTPCRWRELLRLGARGTVVEETTRVEWTRWPPSRRQKRTPGGWWWVTQLTQEKSRRVWWWRVGDRWVIVWAKTKTVLQLQRSKEKQKLGLGRWAIGLELWAKCENGGPTICA